MSIVCPLDPNSPAIFHCAQGGCQVCLAALMEHHAGLVQRVVREQSSGTLSYAELLQAGRIGLWRAVLRYDPGRGVAFSTYAWPAIERHIWQAVARARRPQGWLVPEAPPDPRALAEEQLWWEAVCTALAAAIERLPSRQREVMRAVCGWEGRPPCSLTEIGQQWGATRQAAAYWYYKALLALRLPAVSGRLRRLWEADSREDHRRTQTLSRTWLRRWRRGRRR